VKVASLSQRRFEAAKLQKINLFETERFFLDVYCLEPGQAVLATAGSEHGIENRAGARAAVLVFMAPRPL